MTLGHDVLVGDIVNGNNLYGNVLTSARATHENRVWIVAKTTAFPTLLKISIATMEIRINMV